MKIIIVGGVAGGASAAARIRRLDEQAEIVIYERSGYVSYANCGLPYYIGGIITDKEELTLQTPESFKARFDIDVKIKHEVMAIYPESKTIKVRNLKNNEVFTDSYDKLLLSPGARPVVPELKGIDDERVFSLRTVEDTYRIRNFIEQNNPKSAVIAGGGFIGLEMAENLVDMGIKVELIQRSMQVMQPLDYDMAVQLHHVLRKHGVSLKLGSSVEGFIREGEGIITLLKDEKNVKTDMVIFAIGVEPESSLAAEAGLKLGTRGAIEVNDRMQTSDPDIYAVGDAVQVKHFVTGENTLISLAGPANKQGRIAADNICGGDSRFRGSQGSSVIKVFEMTAASTGINEKTARNLGINYDKVILSPASHASYYPGAKNMIMKIIFERETNRLLGAQITGYDGVDKRIDVLSAAIHAGLMATELAELELAYAPPFSSAKDPVNMAGFIIENIVTGKLKQFHFDEVDNLSRDGSVTLLDTRTRYEYKNGHVEGFKNIPVDELRDSIDLLDPDKPVYVMCQSGLRSYIAVRMLSQYGFDAYNLAGGYGFYSSIKKDMPQAVSKYGCGV